MIAASFSGTDAALTALTTSITIDLLNLPQKYNLIKAETIQDVNTMVCLSRYVYSDNDILCSK